MNRFAKIMQFLGWAGVLLLAAVWVQGFAVGDDAPQLARHSTIALAAACLCVLPRFWTLAYLVLAARGRAVQRRSRVGSGPSPPAERATPIRRQALLASAVALVGLTGSFALAGVILMRRASPLAHATAGFVAIALQIVALFLERRALLADAREMSELAGTSAGGSADPLAAGEAVRGAS